MMKVAVILMIACLIHSRRRNGRRSKSTGGENRTIKK